MDTGYLAAALALAAGITFSLRLLPFGLRARGENSQWLLACGIWLPLGAMVVLAAHGIQVTPILEGSRESLSYGIAILITVGFHLWRGNALLSMGVGTATCMLLLQLVA
ncbi:MAG: AzlD domain-containing protein [Corynebacterium sp.]|nr:AzlD domain-containing protein [Corynebacterium sp.]